MVATAVQKVVRDYLLAATNAGIPAHRAVLFGSQARGDAHEMSDIDLIVLSPEELKVGRIESDANL